jgi:peptidoglycan/LPS O-acetylase OafA/YrhL
LAQNPPDQNFDLERGSVSIAHGVASSSAFRGQERIPELDGLRGLAIFLVILYHYVSVVPHGTSHTWPSRIGTILGQGATGVDLFFVLSGFLIGGILLDSRSSPRYYKTFYLRRFHRIIPLYYSWILLFGLAMMVARKLGGVVGAEFRTAIPYWAYFIFIQNYLFGSTPVQALWLVQTWSLAVEEQFYLISPPLVRNLSKPRLVKLLLAIVAFAFLLRLFLATWFGPNHDNWGILASYFWAPSRSDDLALGVLTAVAWTTPQARQGLQENIHRIYLFLCASAASLLLMLFWMVKPNSYVAATLGRPVYGLFFVSLLIVSLADRQGKLVGLFRWRPLRELGRVSYCVYIIHGAVDWLVFRIVWHAGPRFDSVPSIALSSVAFVSTLALAEVSWRYFEHPLIRRGHRYSY